MLTSLTLLGGLADAGRRSGGGFGGSRGSSYSAPRVSIPRPTPAPRINIPSRPYSPSTPSRTPSSAQRPSTSNISTANRAAAARVTPSQLNAWKSVRLPAGVPRSALTYSAAPTGNYRYQLQPGRYYPYPQSYYRKNNLGSTLLKFAVAYLAVDAISDALSPTVAAPVVPAQNVYPQRSGPDFSDYALMGLLAAGAGWWLFGRKVRR